MYALRDKNTQIVAKLCLGTGHSLVFADHCIEMNYYVNDSLGFISDVLKQEGTGDDFCPTIGHNIDPQQLEVVDLTTLKVVPLNEVFDGYPHDERFIPPLPEQPDEELIVLVRKDSK